MQKLVGMTARALAMESCAAQQSRAGRGVAEMIYKAVLSCPDEELVMRLEDRTRSVASRDKFKFCYY